MMLERSFSTGSIHVHQKTTIKLKQSQGLHFTWDPNHPRVAMLPYILVFSSANVPEKLLGDGINTFAF